LGTTETEIRRHIEEDGGWELGPLSEATITTPPDYVRALREKLGLTQGEFAKRFSLSERTIQEWEQGRAQPDGPARILLRVIEREPKAVERALRFRTSGSR
jgi:putative transcriptional regulator